MNWVFTKTILNYIVQNIDIQQRKSSKEKTMTTLPLRNDFTT